MRFDDSTDENGEERLMIIPETPHEVAVLELAAWMAAREGRSPDEFMERLINKKAAELGIYVEGSEWPTAS